MKIVNLKSWLGVFKWKSSLVIAKTVDELIEALKEHGDKAKCVGSFHSYNTEAKSEVSIRLDGPEFNEKRYFEDIGMAQFGSNVTVEEAMLFLMKRGRRLINSGNFRKQRLIGAAFTGTHGFGRNASIANHVTFFAYIDKNHKFSLTGNNSMLRDENVKAVVGFGIKTAPLSSYNVLSCVCRLSNVKLDPRNEKAMSFIVFPYSSKSDPVTIVTEYTVNTENTPQKKLSKIKTGWLPLSWWRLKLWWFIDRCFPPLRRWVQYSMNFLKLDPIKITTDPQDIDALYHPWPSTDGAGGKYRFSLWAYKPTYTCFNVALFIRPEDIKECISYLIYEAEKIDPYLLRCFIGCRYLSDKSDVSFTGNFEGPVVALDLYCSPKKAASLIKLQNLIQKRFETRPHYGKTVFDGTV